MKRYIVAISIDKVQTFLYYVIHAHTQERQSNSGTLQSIIGASNLISKDFYEDMEEQFREEESLLKCSGVFLQIYQNVKLKRDAVSYFQNIIKSIMGSC